MPTYLLCALNIEHRTYFLFLKGNVVLYAITSAEHGADPGLLAVSFQFTLVINQVVDCLFFHQARLRHHTRRRQRNLAWTKLRKSKGDWCMPWLHHASKINLFQHHISLRRHPSEIILPESISQLFRRLTSIFQHVQRRWNIFEIISALRQRPKEYYYFSLKRGYM